MAVPQGVAVAVAAAVARRRRRRRVGFLGDGVDVAARHRRRRRRRRRIGAAGDVVADGPVRLQLPAAQRLRQRNVADADRLPVAFGQHRVRDARRSEHGPVVSQSASATATTATTATTTTTSVRVRIRKSKERPAVSPAR